MLMRMWRKGNPLALLVGMWTGAATLENCVEVPQEVPYDPAIALLAIYPKDTNIVIRRGTCTPMFIAAMSTIDKLWKEPRCPLTDEKIKKMWDIYIYIHTLLIYIYIYYIYYYYYNYYSAIPQRRNLAICIDMDKTRGYYAKGNKSIRERQLSYELTHMWNLRNKTAS